MNLSLGCVTEKGNYRSKNQDRVMCASQKISGRHMAIACVCDGIGSFQNSEIASEMLINGITKWFEEMVKYYPDVISKMDLIDDLEFTIRELNELICEYSEDRHFDIGCTMSLLLIIDFEYHIFHVGDSCIYRLRDSLFRLTQDEVILKQREGRNRTFLQNYIGKTKQLRLNRQSGFAKLQDVFLLATDGFSKKIVYEDLCDLAIHYKTDDELEQECHRLIQILLERGEKDNISCVILQISGN